MRPPGAGRGTADTHTCCMPTDAICKLRSGKASCDTRRSTGRSPGGVLEGDDRPLLLEVPHNHCREGCMGGWVGGLAGVVVVGLGPARPCGARSSRPGTQVPEAAAQTGTGQACAQAATEQRRRAQADLQARTRERYHQRGSRGCKCAPVPAAVQVPRMCWTFRFQAKCVISGSGPAPAPAFIAGYSAGCGSEGQQALRGGIEADVEARRRHGGVGTAAQQQGWSTAILNLQREGQQQLQVGREPGGHTCSGFSTFQMHSSPSAPPEASRLGLQVQEARIWYKNS